jgi:hypothetical protein
MDDSLPRLRGRIPTRRIGTRFSGRGRMHPKLSPDLKAWLAIQRRGIRMMGEILRRRRKKQ